MCGQRCVIYLKLNAIEKVAVWRAHHFIIGTALENNLPVVGIHYVHLIYIYIYQISYPPTPAFAKAGAAPGTTGGVELGSRVASKGTRPQTLPTLPQASKATTLTATAATSRLPFARPQTPQTLPTRPQASKATTLTATTCPCHLSFRGFKTAVCPPSNPRQQLLQLQLLLQDCRLLGLKPPKRFQPARRPPRQQLLQLLHAPAICLSGGSRLPFARPQTPQTLPQASKAPAICFSGGSRLPFARPQTPQNPPNPPAGLQGNNSYSYMPSNPPNASNPPAGLQGNNSYSYYMPLPSVFQGVQDCRLPALKPPLLLQDCRLLGLKPPKRFQPARRPPRQQLLQLLHAPAICLSGGSRLPFARPQIQGNNSYSYSYYFKTAVCSASNPPNASNPPAGLQGNNSYSYYMPLPSVFQGVQDCRLPALKPPKPSRRPPRHLPSVFQGVQDCRLPALKPPKPSRRPPRHLPSVFQGVQDCRLPALKPPKPSRRPPRQPLLQLHALKPPKRFQPSRRPPRQQLLQLLHAPAICFSGGSRLPFARPQTPQTLPTLPQASKATTLTATTCPCHLFFRGFKTAVCPPSHPPNPPAGLQGTCHLFFRGFKPAVWPPSNPPNPPAGLQGNNSYSYMPSNPPNASNPPAGLQGNNSYSYYMPLPSVFQGVQDCRLPGLKPPKRFQPSRRPPRQQLVWNLALGSQAKAHAPKRFQPSRRPPRQQLLQLQLLLQDCRLLGLKPPKRFQPARRPPRQQLLQLLHAPAICLSGGSRLPFARPQIQGNNSYSYSYYFKTAVCSASNPPNASNPPAGLQGNNSYSYYMPLPSVFQGVQDCRLPALKPPKPSRRPPRHLPSVFQGVQDCRLPALKPPKPPKPSRRPPRQQLLQLHALKPPKRFQPSRRPPRQQLLQLLHAPAICFSGGSRLPFARPQTPLLLQDCRLLGLKPPKRFQPARRPPRQQLLQLLHAPAICLTGGSRLPFARPQIQGNNSYSYSYYFKTAVCSASNPPNASNPPAGLQGNNSYSYYMPLPSVFQVVQDCRLPALKPPKPSRRPPRHLPSVFQGVQDCRLPALKPPKPPKPSRRPPRQQLLQLHALKPPKRFQPSRRPPRQQLLQRLHAPAICFSGGSRLPFARPQTPQTLPQASKATTLTATCPQTPKRFQPSRRPPRQQLLQLLHAPAICFSGGSSLPFARPQTPQTLPTLPQASKATTLTATTCPCHLFFRGFKTAVCPPSNPPNPPAGLQGTCHLFFRGFKPAVWPPSNPPNPPAGLQGNNSYSYMPSNPPNASNPPAGLQGNNSYSYYMPLPSVFQGVQDCHLPGLKPPKRFQPSRRPPRQQLLQLLHAPAICFSGGSRLPFARPQTPQTLPQASKAPAICFSGGSSLPFGRPQTPQTLPQASKARTLTATCPQTPQTLPTLPQASKATTLTATTCPCHLSFRGFKTAVSPPSNPPNFPAGLQGICHLFFRGFKTAVCPPSNPPNPPNPPAGLQGNNSYSYMPSNPPNASNSPAGLQGNNSYSYYMPLPSAFQGVQDCRLPALKPPKPSRRPPRQQLLRLHALKPPKRFQPSRRPPRQQLLQLLHAPAICFSGGSRLPFARPQTPQTLPTLPQASKATTLTATTCPCHLFFRGFKPAVCPPSNPPNPPAGLQGTCHLFFRGFKPAVWLPSNPPNPPAGLQGNNSYSHMPSNPPNASNPPAGLQGNNSYSYYMPLPSVFQGVQDCRLPGLKPPKRFQPSRRPPRQQLLQLLHAPAICFSGGARLPPTPAFATAGAAPGTTGGVELGSRVASKGTRPQTLPTLPQASKATTLTATATTSRLPFARPQTPQTLPTRPQASKATTLTATTCPCHLSFRGFKIAVCPPSNPRQQLLQLQLLLQDCRLLGLKPPKRFQPARRPPRQQLLQLLHAPAICLSGGSRLPFARPQTPQTLPQASKAPAICFSGGSRLRRPPRQQLLQLHAPAICFSGGAWATRACDSPSLLGLLFWHEPFCFLAWFPSRRVMVDVNLPKRTA